MTDSWVLDNILNGPVLVCHLILRWGVGQHDGEDYLVLTAWKDQALLRKQGHQLQSANIQEASTARVPGPLGTRRGGPAPPRGPVRSSIASRFSLRVLGQSSLFLASTGI